jgi:zinc transporter ZupT
MTTSARYTTNYPRLTLAAVLVLGACAEWLAATGAALIMGAM